MSDGEGGDLAVDLYADYGWFHVMRSRIMEGVIGDIGFPAMCVYLVIKAHAGHRDGVAYPSQERIAELMKCSVDTVSRATKALVAAGLLSERQRGRHKEYQLLERAPVTERDSGALQGAAEWPYVPREFANQLQAVRNFIEKGVPPGCTINLTINMIQQRDHGNVTINAAPADAAQRADTAELARRLRGL